MNSLLRIVRTTAFRQALAFMVIFTLTVQAVLTWVLWNADLAFRSGFRDAVRDELAMVDVFYQENGIEATRVLIEQFSLAERRGAGRGGAYLLARLGGGEGDGEGDGEILAGNFSFVPRALLGDDEMSGWIEYAYDPRQRRFSVSLPSGSSSSSSGAETIEGEAMYRHLSSDYAALIGRAAGGRKDLLRVFVRNALAGSLIFSALAGVLMGLAAGRLSLQRISRVTSVADDIMDGDLSRRIPLPGDGAELDRLADHLNRGFERLGTLVTGIREVSENVAHDLKTPLTRIKARLEDALSSEAAVDRALLDRTLADIDDLLRAFNALLALARLDSGEPRGEMETLDLGDMTREIAELYRPAIEEGGGRLGVSIADRTFARAHRALMSRALANLLDNVLVHGRVSGRPLSVRVSCRREADSELGDVAALEIDDNGAGISSERREFVRRRFTRLDGSRSKSGSGLGISLADATASLHGGRLDIAASDLGGTRMRLLTPRVAVPKGRRARGEMGEMGEMGDAKGGSKGESKGGSKGESKSVS